MPDKFGSSWSNAQPADVTEQWVGSLALAPRGDDDDLDDEVLDDELDEDELDDDELELDDDLDDDEDDLDDDLDDDLIDLDDEFDTEDEDKPHPSHPRRYED